MKLDNKYCENLSEIEQNYCDNDVRALCECIGDNMKTDRNYYIEYQKHVRKTIKNCIIMFIGSLIFWGILFILVIVVYF